MRGGGLEPVVQILLFCFPCRAAGLQRNNTFSFKSVLSVLKKRSRGAIVHGHSSPGSLSGSAAAAALRASLTHHFHRQERRGPPQQQAHKMDVIRNGIILPTANAP